MKNDNLVEYLNKLIEKKESKKEELIYLQAGIRCVEICESVAKYFQSQADISNKEEAHGFLLNAEGANLCQKSIIGFLYKKNGIKNE